MADRTPIEWTDATWNPITGCAVVSPGCTNCYAMRLAGTRMKHHPSRVGLTQESKAGPVWTGEVRFNEEWLAQPLRWSKPRMIFVCAHGDLFAEGVPDEWIDRVFAVMALAPQHTFQVLTKRPERMREYLSADRFKLAERVADAVMYLWDGKIWDHGDRMWDQIYGAIFEHPLSNVWLGASVEDQRRADERIPVLLDTPAAVRWISAEPLLGPVDLMNVQVGEDCSAEFAEGDPDLEEWGHLNALEGGVGYPRLDWVVVGGESGPDARPMHPGWARSIMRQCAEARVPFLFKQWGEWMPFEGHEDVALGTEFILADVMLAKVGKKRAGRLLDGVTHDGMPA